MILPIIKCSEEVNFQSRFIKQRENLILLTLRTENDGLAHR